MSDAEMWIQEDGFPVPEDAEQAVGSWSCPKCGWTIGPLRGNPCITMLAECPFCHTKAEILPLAEAPDAD